MIATRIDTARHRPVLLIFKGLQEFEGKGTVHRALIFGVNSIKSQGTKKESVNMDEMETAVVVMPVLIGYYSNYKNEEFILYATEICH